MSDRVEQNPYAPTRSNDVLRLDETGLGNQVPTIGVLAATFGGIVVSGAAFGMFLGVVFAIASQGEVVSTLVVLPVGLVAGAVIAGISGIPTVLVTLCLSSPLVPLAKGWYRYQARAYGGICGFFSGSLPLILTDVRDVQSWLLSLVPGVFGAVGTILFVRWVIQAPRSRAALVPGHTLVEDSGNNVT